MCVCFRHLLTRGFPPIFPSRESLSPLQPLRTDSVSIFGRYIQHVIPKPKTLPCLRSEEQVPALLTCIFYVWDYVALSRLLTVLVARIYCNFSFSMYWANLLHIPIKTLRRWREGGGVRVDGGVIGSASAYPLSLSPAIRLISRAVKGR